MISGGPSPGETSKQTHRPRTQNAFCPLIKIKTFGVRYGAHREIPGSLGTVPRSRSKFKFAQLGAVKGSGPVWVCQPTDRPVSSLFDTVIMGSGAEVLGVGEVV